MSGTFKIFDFLKNSVKKILTWELSVVWWLLGRIPRLAIQVRPLPTYKKSTEGSLVGAYVYHKALRNEIVDSAKEWLPRSLLFLVLTRKVEHICSTVPIQHFALGT